MSILGGREGVDHNETRMTALFISDKVLGGCLIPPEKKDSEE
jgi:hypothetical protein